MEWITPQWLVSFASMLVALVALVFSVWQGIETRRHNRLSVKPYLTIDTQYFSLHGHIGLRLQNNGLGPLIIKKAFIERNPSRQLASLFTPEFIELMPSIQLEQFAINVLSENYSLLPTGEFWIFYATDVTQESSDAIRQAMSGIRIEVHFESIYGEKYSNNKQYD